LGLRTLLTPSGALQQLLVQWKGLSKEEATWEELEDFRNTWPLVNLEDKVVLKGGSDDTDRTLKERSDVLVQSGLVQEQQEMG